MNKKDIFPRPGIQIQLAKKKDAEESGTNTEIQIIRSGIYNHLWYGELNISKETLLSMIASFDAGVMKNDLMIDYNHEVCEAAAWIRKLYIVEEDGQAQLWATVDWTPEGKKCVDDKEYRYISADFNFNHVDNESGVQYGPVLYGAALTNRPFVKGMAPTAQLHETNGGYMNLEQLSAENKKLSSRIEEIEKSNAAEIKRLADEKDAAVKLAADKDAELKKISDAKVLADKETEFSKMLSEGKVVPAQKEAFLKGDMTEFLAKAGNPKLKQEGAAAETEESNGDEDEKFEKVMKLAKEKVDKKEFVVMGDAISCVLSENPDLR